MWEHKDADEKCNHCGNVFIKRMIYYPSNLDEKHESYYCCPYCGKGFSIHLRGNEDVETLKKDF